MKLISVFKKIGRVIYSTLLCIKYPFLYPRNRWTDKHYNCWKIIEYHRENYRKAYHLISLQITDKEVNSEEQTEYYKFLDTKKETYLRTDYSGDELVIYLGRNKGTIEKIIKKIKLGSKIYDSSWVSGKNVLVLKVNSVEELKEDYNGGFNCIRLTINQILAFKIKILDWIEKYPLQIIHFPTYYTELDSMDKGWKDAFGMNFCKDLRKALIKTGGYKLLFRFRILQIKEKYGRLEVYCIGYNDEINKVISKYSKLSEKTCIRCGKPATWISKGWISPYCDDCVPDKINAIKC